MFDRTGDKEIYKDLAALKFYEEQVIRQAILNHNSISNLFYLTEEEKRKIVETHIDDYIKYFIYKSSEYNFIWGNITNTTVNLLNCSLETSLIYKTNSKIIKNKLITVLTNYMTLEELKNGAIENHTLDRFILEKLPSNNVK